MRDLSADTGHFFGRPTRVLWAATAALVLVLVLAGLRFGVQINGRRAALREIKRLHGTFVVQDRCPGWLQDAFDGWFRTLFVYASQVDLNDTQATDETLSHLRWLTTLEELRLDNTHVTDVGVSNLAGLKRLRVLWLDNTPTTDAGASHLAGLSELRELSLTNTRVTDSGLAHLEGLVRLQWLFMNNTAVSDAGLPRLRGMTEMQGLWLYETGVTARGASELRRFLPGLEKLRFGVRPTGSDI